MAELNPALLDIQEIVAERPELEPAEWEIVGKATDWLKATLKPEVRKELEVEYAKRQGELETILRGEMQVAIRDNMEAWRKEQEPLSNEDITKLVNQEYVEFAIQIRETRGAKKKRSFTIVELPKAIEKRFIHAAQSFLIPLIEQVNAADWKLDGSLLEQIEGLLQKSPAALDAAGELVAIILDPWEEDKDITKGWVDVNMSIPRISYVLMAQAEANKYRDFFLNGFRSFRSLRTT